jgi:phosphoribosyl 1,2-cyclic phosphodiesterase
MSLAFCVLASGSSGNCTVLRLDGGRRHVLIDAGLSPRETQRRLEPLGLGLDAVGAILLTHLDADHLAPGWLGLVEELDLPVRVHRRHVRAAARLGLPVPAMQPFDVEFALAPHTVVRGLLMAHDDLGAVAYVIDHRGARLGFATDLGCVPPALLAAFTGLHALALESNYDRAMQSASSRPEFLKRRIMGGLGHLSNEQALVAATRIAARSELAHLVLLHLSRECNSPALVRRLYAARAPHLARRLTIAGASAATPWLQVHGAPLTLWG